MTWALHHGDCLAGLATLEDQSVDHVVTDPPYSAHVHASVRSGLTASNRPGGGVFSQAKDLGFDSITPRQIEDLSDQFARVARRWVLVFSDIESSHLWRGELTSAGLEYVRTGFWHKLGGAPQFTGDRPAVACEAITIAHRPGRKRWNGGGRQAFWQHSIALAQRGGGKREHPTQKPLALMRALAEDFTDPGDLVLDPFAGSGTTGVAALSLGRRFLGWEMDAKHHATATRRLGETREQPNLLTRGPKAKQIALGGLG